MGSSLADAGQCNPGNATASNDPEWTHIRVMLEVPLLAVSGHHAQSQSVTKRQYDRRTFTYHSIMLELSNFSGEEFAGAFLVFHGDLAVVAIRHADLGYTRKT